MTFSAFVYARLDLCPCVWFVQVSLLIVAVALVYIETFLFDILLWTYIQPNGLPNPKAQRPE